MAKQLPGLTGQLCPERPLQYAPAVANVSVVHVASE